MISKAERTDSVGAKTIHNSSPETVIPLERQNCPYALYPKKEQHYP